ncbi:hypothetical protein N0V87_006311 [Didymella glomerata]|uniref:Extracellular membrane protein CFEM domain-containing protein n=1 Tax=Didymella glomerata TaxID=749621 RepID=A0A9W9BYY9_9PLEO|nr:hypothetical protein N0V87_006311 [Didymella glomerata]
MRPSTLLPAVLSILTTTQAAIKTSIYIDQIPAYSSLAPCAENRVSAVVRAQASGCGDEQQLTSFSCFCVEQYSHISSVISTAVQDYCAAQATTLTASATAPLPEVTSAIEVFNSYCARSTELAWYPATASITTAPSATPAVSSAISTSTSAPQESSSKSVPVAAIAAPVVIGVLAIAGVVGLLFFLRRRKAAAKLEKENPYAPPTYADESRGTAHGDVHELLSPTHEHEVPGDTVKYRYELESRPAELEGDRGRKQ